GSRASSCSESGDAGRGSARRNAAGMPAAGVGTAASTTAGRSPVPTRSAGPVPAAPAHHGRKGTPPVLNAPPAGLSGVASNVPLDVPFDIGTGGCDPSASASRRRAARRDISGGGTAAGRFEPVAGLGGGVPESVAASSRRDQESSSGASRAARSRPRGRRGGSGGAEDASVTGSHLEEFGFLVPQEVVDDVDVTSGDVLQLLLRPVHVVLAG